MLLFPDAPLYLPFATPKGGAELQRFPVTEKR
jgi:hypothetical protein